MQDLVQLPRSELDDKTDVVGLGALAAPGESDVALARFSKPGRYGVACFVPVGTTTVGAATDAGPHTDKGMVADFVVKSREWSGK